MKKLVGDMKAVQDLADGVGNQVLYGLRLMVEGRNRRQDDRAERRGGQHQFQVPFVERRLSHHQHQGAATAGGRSER